MEQNRTILSELREGASAVKNEVSFKKRMFGGCDVKEVSEFIKALKDSMRHAERSFSERLEEYAVSLAMITQERDKYIKLVKENESQQLVLKQSIDSIKEENEQLNKKINEMAQDLLTQNDLQDFENTLLENEAMKKQIEEMEGKLKEFEQYRYDNIKMQSINDQLETTNAELLERIEEYEREKITKEQYEIVLAENAIVKKKYEEIMSEKSRLFADKNILTQQNKRLSDSLQQVKEENRELRELNTTIKLQARNMRAEFEAKTYECGQNHKRNMDQISESLKTALNILCYDKMDVTNLISGSYDELEIQIDHQEDSIDAEQIHSDSESLDDADIYNN